MTLQPVAAIFPDAEAWATSALAAALDARDEDYAAGVIVDHATPNPRPVRLVTIRRDGGLERGVFDNPRFGVNVWAGTYEDATDLARLVSALFRLLPGDGVCTKVRQSGGISPIPDAAPRLFMSFEATLRGEPL